MMPLLFRIFSFCIIAIVMLVLTSCTPDYVLPEDEASYIEAKALYENREFDEAIKLFEEICIDFSWSDNVDNSQYFIGASWLGKATDINGDLTAPIYLPYAKEAFLKVEKNSTRYVDALCGIGEVHYLLAEYDSSRNYCFTIYEMYPASDIADNALLILGNSYRKLGEYDSSIVWYEDVIENYIDESAYDNALYWAADYYYDRKNIEANLIKAKEYYETYILIADTLDDKYEKATIRLNYLEGLQ